MGICKEANESRKIVLVSTNYTIVEDNPQRILSALKQLRQYYNFDPKEVFTLENAKEADIIARVRHLQLCNIFGMQPLQLPAAGNLCLRRENEIPFAKEVPQLVTQPAYNTGLDSPHEGFWLIAAANGYSVASDDRYLCDCLQRVPFKYIHAIWSPTPDYRDAIFRAREEYLARFFSRYGYDFHQYVPFLNKADEVFIDADFELREQNRGDDATWQNLQSFRLF